MEQKLTEAYKEADAVLEEKLTDAYTKVDTAITTVYKVADAALKTELLKAATVSSNGMMSATDKKKLDGISLWSGMQAQYNTIASKDAAMIYIITL